MNRLGTTVVVATHSEDLPGRHPARMLTLEGGRRGRRWLNPRRRLARDPLGLRKALADRLLLGLVAAMALLAALALAGRDGADRLAAALARRRAGRRHGAGARTHARTHGRAPWPRCAPCPRSPPPSAVDPARMAELLRPWLGGAHGVPLPGVIELRLADLSADPVRIGDRVAAEVPGAVTEAHGVWVAHLAALARAVQGVALAVLALVAGVAAAVVAVAVRAGLSARRDAVLVLHGLGATDAEVAGRFARRVALSGGAGRGGRHAGGAAGAGGPGRAGRARWRALRTGRACPGWTWRWCRAVAALVGWLTTQATVRLWLRRLP